MTRHISLDSRPDLKQPERERIAEQVEAFLAKGGKIKTFTPTERKEQDDKIRFGAREQADD